MKLARWIGVGIIFFNFEMTLFAEDRVYIRGSKKEKYHRNKGGRAKLIKPKSPSRMNTEILLNEESSMAISKDDKISATGFAIPSVRGQDSKLTDISLGNMLIYDPLSSLPLFNEPDLMAFGQIEIYHGVTPWYLPGSSPTGHIRYHMPAIIENRSQAGIQTGSPFGHSLWLKQQGSQGFDLSDLSYSIFGRTHQSNGEFNYYDDHGNPWVPKDGSYKSRKNNDSRTHLIMPWIKLESRSHTFEIAALSLMRTQGVAGYGRRLSLGRQNTKANLFSFSWGYHFERGALLAPDLMEITGLVRKDKHELDDPYHPVLKQAYHQGTEVITHEERINFIWKKEHVQSMVSIQKGVAELNQSSAGHERSQYQRKHYQGAGTVHLVHFDWLNSEFKGSARSQSDFSDHANELYKILAEEEPDSFKRSGYYKNVSYSLYGNSGGFGYYLQSAWTERPPGLWEFFGDSDFILPNLSLEPEKIRHHEFGLWYRFRHPDLRVFISLYRDQMEDKIFLLPAYAGTYRAQNLRSTRISGLESGLDWNLPCDLYTSLNFSMTDPVWETSTRQKKLPGISDKQGVVTLGYEWQKKLNFRISSKVQGKKYLDEDNSKAVNRIQLWDTGLDYQLDLPNSVYYAGISITNFMDKKEMDIYSPQKPAQKGRTGLSDISGVPVPGRQWVFSISGEW